MTWQILVIAGYWLLVATIAVLAGRKGMADGKKKRIAKSEPPPLPPPPAPVMLAIEGLRRELMEKVTVEFDATLDRLDQLDESKIHREAAVNTAVGELSRQMLDVWEAVKEHHQFEDARHKVTIERDDAVDVALAELLSIVRKRQTVNLRLTNGRCATGNV